MCAHAVAHVWWSEDTSAAVSPLIFPSRSWGPHSFTHWPIRPPQMINFKGERAYTRGEIDYLGRKQTAQDPGHIGEAMDDRKICHYLQVNACPCHRREAVSVQVKTWALCDTPGPFPQGFDGSVHHGVPHRHQRLPWMREQRSKWPWSQSPF